MSLESISSPAFNLTDSDHVHTDWHRRWGFSVGRGEVDKQIKNVEAGKQQQLVAELAINGGKGSIVTEEEGKFDQVLVDSSASMTGRCNLAKFCNCVKAAGSSVVEEGG